MFIWNIVNVEGGNVDAIISLAKQAGLTHLLIKIADGVLPHNAERGRDRAKELVQACKANGVLAVGWQFVYGYYPEREAEMAIRRVKETGVESFLIDAEGHFEKPGWAERARSYLRILKPGLPGLSIGLSSFRWPSVHRPFPWKVFLDAVDYVMPQVYWMKAHNAAAQLQRSLAEYRKIGLGTKPFIPTGAAYQEWGWRPTPAEIHEFLVEARKTCQGANFWVWEHARRYPELWEVIRSYGWGNDPVIPVGEAGEETEPVVIRALVGRVKAGVMNYRSGPGTRFTDLGDLVQGAEVPVLGIAGSDFWVKIGENPERWAAAEYGGKSYMEIRNA